MAGEGREGGEGPILSRIKICKRRERSLLSCNAGGRSHYSPGQ